MRCSKTSVSAFSATRNNRGALAALGLLLAAGCATQKGAELPELGSWQQRTTVLAAIDEFDFSGRVAVRAGDDGFNGKLRWRQDEAAFSAAIGGPLGIGTVQIESDGRQVEITDSDGSVTVLDDVERDLYFRYGWTIPVESLRYWALGIPDPRVPAETVFGDDGLLAELGQRGWQVRFSRYRDAGGGQPMPALIAAENHDTSVKIVIDRWVFREAPPAPW